MIVYDADVIAAMDVWMDGNFTRGVCDYPAIPDGVPCVVNDELIEEVVGDSDFKLWLGL